MTEPALYDPNQSPELSVPVDSLFIDTTSAENLIMEDNQTTVETQTELIERPSLLRRNLNRLSLGMLVVGGAYVSATQPLDKLLNELKESVPVVAAGGATEAMFIGGIAVMAVSAGKKIGNPFKLRSRWNEIKTEVNTSRMYETGLKLNTAGAIGTAAVAAVGAGTILPPETWPGAFTLAAVDIAGTIALRSPLYAGIRNARTANTSGNVGDGVAEKERQPKIKVRRAKLEDVDQMADIDLLLFDEAYGDEKPSKQETIDMLTKRLQNNPDGIFVAEMNGKIGGFVSAFRTDTLFEDFVSWEESTGNGTLDGKVRPKGKYVYVTNMTIMHEAVEAGAEDMLLANLFANGIRDGVKYGYFASRMPQFKEWIEANGLNDSIDDEQEMQRIAEGYANMRREDGKKYDWQLRMYDGYGYRARKVVNKAFSDSSSLSFGVVYTAEVPPNKTLKKIKPIRAAMASSLRLVARNPKLLRKVL